MSVAADTSHEPMGPCGPVVQVPCGDSLRHASMARLSSVLFCGENARVEVMVFIADDMVFVVVVAVAIVEVVAVFMVEVTVVVVVVEVAAQTVDDIDPEEPVNMLT